MADQKFSIAVFPFLKTRGPVKLGGYTFRSTTDLEGLPSHQAKAVGEIAQMLFVHDDFRVKSASYAILPDIEVHSGDRRIAQLAQLRAVVAYFYSAPHETFESIFLAPEDVSLVLFTPDRVPIALTRPEHHTERVLPLSGSAPDGHGYVPGYNGLYNFRHAFWVEPGSRLYGPKPHMGLTIAQDLCSDIGWGVPNRPDYYLLHLLDKPESSTSQRIYAALHWYNAANENGIDQSQALLNLAVAFETLLRLPESSKKDRLVDAISLLLGRTERLDEWAEQFYAARSRVAHEGQLIDGYFYASTSGKQKQTSDLFGSLMLFGRQIFQLCVGTVLVGIDLADRANLQEKFVTNNERYQKICELLEVKTTSPNEKLLGLEPTIRAIERYQFVASNVSTGPAITAVRQVCIALTACGQELPLELADALAACASSKRQDGEARELEVIECLDCVFEKLSQTALSSEARLARAVIRLVWMNLSRRYYWLKGRQEGTKHD